MSDLMTPPPPEPGEEVIERDEAAKRRSPEFREAKCRGWLAGLGWHDIEGRRWSHSNERPLAEMDVGRAVGFYGSGTLFYVQIEPPDPSRPRRKCSITAMLGADVVSLLKLSPNNATFRARVMAKLNESPPKDCDTYDKLKDWVEFNFPKAQAAPPPEEKLMLRVHATESESGRCRYSRTLSGSGSISLSRAEIAEIIGNNSSLEEAESEAHDLLRDKAQNNISMDDDGNEETSEHEMRDSDGIDLDYDSTSLRKFIRKIAEETITDAADRSDYGLE